MRTLICVALVALVSGCGQPKEVSVRWEAELISGERITGVVAVIPTRNGIDTNGLMRSIRRYPAVQDITLTVIDK